MCCLQKIVWGAYTFDGQISPQKHHNIRQLHTHPQSTIFARGEETPIIPVV
jgi:hypothetical protein